jgi:ABC-2 type transport system permease protein
VLAAGLMRLLRLWRVYAYLDLLFVTRNLRSLLIYYTSDAVLAVAAVTATFLLAERFGSIGAWTRDQVLFMLGYAILVRAIPDLFFGYNVMHVSRRIGRGQFDHTLVQPLPVWLSLGAEGFMPFSGSGALVPALVLTLWAGARLSLPPSLPWLALLALNLAASVAIYLSFSFLWGSLAFWAPHAAEEISSSATAMLGALKPFPLDGVGPILAGSLLTLVPAGFVAWYPCRALLGLDPAPYGAAVTPVAAVGFALVTVVVFARGMRHYGRTGSQRYLPHGFRR